MKGEDPIKFIVIEVLEDNLTDKAKTEEVDQDNFDDFEADLKELCEKHGIKVGGFEHRTRYFP